MTNRMVEKVHSGLKPCLALSEPSAATNAYVFHQAHMVIKKNALATTTGKHRKANPSVLDYIIIPDSKSQATSSFPFIFISAKFIRAINHEFIVSDDDYLINGRHIYEFQI
ncbi:hypothetical protein MKW92_032600 [Papaver armeniacum]|nr:hypothetical protein MKW92_032600 [Papaver armeniacum]